MHFLKFMPLDYGQKSEKSVLIIIEKKIYAVLYTSFSQKKKS